jgi:L-aminopeptidase/D-esterase-like protein
VKTLKNETIDALFAAVSETTEIAIQRILKSLCKAEFRRAVKGGQLVHCR